VRRFAIFCEVLAAGLTLTVSAVALATARPDRALAGVLVAIAVVWSAVPLIAELAMRGRRDARDGSHAVSSIGTVTTIIRLGDEPLEVARTSISLATRAGPVAVVAAGRDVPGSLSGLGVPIYRARTIERAVAAAARQASTYAMLIISARAVPCMDECRKAAGALGGTTAWAVGSVSVFNDDGYVPDGREIVGARLRSRARSSGLDLWETDATLVRTDVLRDHAIQRGRPWGMWLRDLRAVGLRGIEHPGVLALRAAPADAAGYWPDTMARQRGAAADLADAAISGRPVARLLAAALLSRELFAFPLLIWLALPVVVGSSGEFPFDTRALPSLAVVVLLAAARWASLRVVLDVPLRPFVDLTSALHHIPGSLASVVSAFTRRVRPPRVAVSTRPLVWAALFLTVLTGCGLVGRPSAEPVPRIMIGLGSALLGALWLFSMRAFMQRNWGRSTFRLPLQLDAVVGGIDARTSDGSPTGLALAGSFSGSLGHEGERVDVSVNLDDGSVLRSSAVIAGYRVRGEGQLLGLSLELDDDGREAWLGQLFRAARAETVSPRSGRADRVSSPSDAEPTGGRDRLAIWIDRLLEALVLAVSIAGLIALLVVMLGYRPFVIRSGSMIPTLEVGDVVIADTVPASVLEPDDIVTRFYSPELGESITHRVVRVAPTDGGLRVTTKGDANTLSERWIVTPETKVGRMAWSIPRIGAAAIRVRTLTAKLAIGLIALALVIAALLRSRVGGPFKSSSRRSDPDSR